MKFLKHKSKTVTSVEFILSTCAFIVPIFMVLLCVPLCVKLRKVYLDEYTSLYFLSPLYEMHAVVRRELFLVLTVLAISMLIGYFIWYLRKGRSTFEIQLMYHAYSSLKLYLWCSIVFLIFTFLSALFANAKEVAFWGYYQHSEGFVTQVSYIVFFLLSAITVLVVSRYKIKGKKHIYNGDIAIYFYMIIPLVILLMVNGFIGCIQKNMMSPYDIELIQRFIAGPDYKQFTFSPIFDDGSVFGVLFNPNYAGAYSVLMVPFFSYLILATRKLWMRIVFGICAIVAFIFAVWSNSASALVGIGMAVFMSVILKINWRKVKKYRKRIGVVFGILMVCCLGVGLVCYDTLSMKMEGIQQAIVAKDDASIIKKAVVNQGDLILQTNEQSYQFTVENENLILRNQGDVIKTVNRNQFEPFHIEETELEPVTFSISDVENGGQILLIEHEYLVLRYRMTEAGIDSLLSPFSGLPIVMDQPELALEGLNPKLGTTRMYIWSRTLPLLPQCLVLGYGPDNFIYEFPQNDYLGKYEIDVPMTFVYTKPHNMYLQLIINNGGIAFLAFAIMMSRYIINGYKIYRTKRGRRFIYYVGKGIYVSIVGFLMTAIFVDSMIYYAPIFWILFGSGVGVNAVLEKKVVREKSRN